jgi:hypothetical protein
MTGDELELLIKIQQRCWVHRFRQFGVFVGARHCLFVSKRLPPSPVLFLRFLHHGDNRFMRRWLIRAAAVVISAVLLYATMETVRRLVVAIYGTKPPATHRVTPLVPVPK